MAKNQLKDLYDRYSADFISAVASNDFYAFFMDAMQKQQQNMTVYEKYIERIIDMSWVEAIEKAIIPLDNIVRAPNRYIRRDEDIVRIELAREVAPEAIRHLAQHTNMIASVEKDTVTPERILNITKEEAIDTYENRFIFTLLRQVEYFVDRRMAVLNEKSKLADQFEYKLEGQVSAGNDNVEYNFSMNFTTPHQELEGENLLEMDTTRLSAMARVERIRKIVYTFRYTPFMKQLAGCTPVRPPLTMTNVLTKNPNFVQAIELWNFISMYDSVGFSMDFVDRQVTPGEQAVQELYSVVLLQYMLLKQYSHRDVLVGEVDEHREKLAPNIIKRNIENILNTFDLSIDEVRRIFADEINKKERKRDAQFNNARAIISRAITAETSLARTELLKRKEKLEREKKREMEMRKAEERRRERERLEAERKEQQERRAKFRAEEARKRAEKKRLLEEERLRKRIERQRAAAERAERERLEAEERAKVKAEKDRLRAEKEEAERIQKLRRAAELEENRKRREAEQKAKEEKRRLKAERKAAEEAAAKAAAEAEAARLEAERQMEAARIAAEKAREAEEARRKATEAEAEAQRLTELLRPYKAEQERISGELDRARTMPRKKKKAAKKKLQKDLEAVRSAMPTDESELKSAQETARTAAEEAKAKSDAAAAAEEERRRTASGKKE